MRNKKFNAVIVGCGSVAPVHAEAIINAESAKLYGACDTDGARLSGFSGRYNIKDFNSLNDVLNDANVDVVHICTPHYLHKDMILQCMESGKEIVAEKPVAITIEDLRLLYGAWQNTNSRIMSVLQNRLNPCVLKMKEMVSGNMFGKLLGLRGNLYWRRDQSYYSKDGWRGKRATEGGGLVINQAIHMLDMLDYLGGGAKEIKGGFDTRLLDIEVEDTAEATLYFEDDVRGHFFATNTYGRDEPYEITLTFERETFRYVNKKLFDGGFNLIAEDENGQYGKSCWGNSHRTIIDKFYSSLAGRSADYPSLRDGLRAAELALGLYESAKTGKKYKMEIDI